MLGTKSAMPDAAISVTSAPRWATDTPAFAACLPEPNQAASTRLAAGCGSSRVTEVDVSYGGDGVVVVAGFVDVVSFLSEVVVPVLVEVAVGFDGA